MSSGAHHEPSNDLNDKITERHHQNSILADDANSQQKGITI